MSRHEVVSVRLDPATVAAIEFMRGHQTRSAFLKKWLAESELVQQARDMLLERRRHRTPSEDLNPASANPPEHHDQTCSDGHQIMPGHDIPGARTYFDGHGTMPGHEDRTSVSADRGGRT